MGYVYDAFKGNLFHEHQIKMVASDPVVAKEGSLIVNTSTNEMKIYFSGSWQVLHTLTIAALSYFLQEDGTSYFLQEDGTSKLALQ